MDSVVKGENPNHRGKSATWRDIGSDIFVDKSLIESEDIIEFPSLYEFTHDRDTRGSNDGHISIKAELNEPIIFDAEKYLRDIGADAIDLTIANSRVFHHSLVRRILRIFDDEFLGGHGKRVFSR